MAFRAILGSMAILAASLTTASGAIVTNGDFSAGLTGWTWTAEAGAEASMTPGAAPGPFATGDAFRVNPGNNSGGAAQLGGTLSQSVFLSAGVQYTVSGDLAIQNLTQSPNADGGLISILLGGGTIHSFDVDVIQPLTTLTNAFSVQFTPAVSGNALLELHFARGFFNFAPTMLHWADNIDIVPAPGSVVLLSAGLLPLRRRRC